MIAALRHNTSVDYAAMIFSNIFYAIPSFLIATLLIYFVALQVGAGSRRAAGRPGSTRSCRRSRSASRPMALFARLVRGTMLETLQQDYVRTARAKGLRYRRVVGLHVLRNSLIPVVTAAGPLLGFIITGSFVIELIFNIPGIGQYYVTAVSARDYSVVMGLTVLLCGDRDLRESRGRHPLRHPRSANAGRADLSRMVANPPTARRAAHRRPPAPLRRCGSTDPPVEPLEGRLAPLHPQQGRRRRGSRLRAHPPLLPDRADHLAA